MDNEFVLFKKKLGDLVKEERTRRQLSQISLSELANVSLRTISDIENYTANPRLDTLFHLASYLDLSLDSVLHNKQIDDADIRKILAELEDSSVEDRRIALDTLRGLLPSLRKNR